jgi:hypothetical protein
LAPDQPRDVTIPLNGRVRITTKSGSTYEIDFDSMYLRRIRGTTPSPDPDALPASHLRRDGETLKILRVIRLRVGRRAVFDVQPLGDPRIVAFTRRTTTNVETIERIGTEPDEPNAPSGHE